MYLQGCWSVTNLSSSLDNCVFTGLLECDKISSSLDSWVFTELLLSEGSLVRGGEYVDVTSVREEGVEGGSTFIRE